MLVDLTRKSNKECFVIVNQQGGYEYQYSLSRCIQFGFPNFHDNYPDKTCTTTCNCGEMQELHSRCPVDKLSALCWLTSHCILTIVHRHPAIAQLVVSKEKKLPKGRQLVDRDQRHPIHHFHFILQISTLNV